MFRHDYLEAGRIFSCKAQKSSNRRRTAWRSASVSFSIDLRPRHKRPLREIDLCRLIDEEELRKWLTVVSCKPMQGKKRSQMIREMIPTAARPRHVYRAAGPINHNRQMVQVKASRKLTEFAAEIGYVPDMCIEIGLTWRELLARIVGPDLPLKVLSLSFEPLLLRQKADHSGVRY